MAKIYPFRSSGFHTPVERKIGYYIINKQIIIQILILNTAFHIYGNMRLKEIRILNLFEQIQENTNIRLGFFGSARQLGHGFHTRPLKMQNFHSQSFLEVAQLDACPTGDLEVAGSTPTEVGNILSWRLIVKYFLRSFSPFRWFKKGSCQFLAKECAQYWLTA